MSKSQPLREMCLVVVMETEKAPMRVQGTGMVNATGGIFMSFCSDWTSPKTYKQLAEASVILDSYPLDNTAVAGSIGVCQWHTSDFRLAF